MKTLIAAVFLCLSPALSGAAEAPFTIASESLPPLPEGTEPGNILLRLQQQAVREYLQKVLGPRYERYESQITPEFAIKYIAKYQVDRQSTDSSEMQISGSLDVDALREFIRTSETKAMGSTTLKPLFIFSASLPGLTIDPRQTAAGVKQANSLVQTVYRSVGDLFQKFNAALGTSEDTGLGMTQPPARETDVRSLKSYGLSAGYNSAVWVHFASCRGCGVRADIHLYNLSQGRQVLVTSADAELDMSDLSDPKKVTKSLSKLFQEFGTAFEDSISKGTLFAIEYKVIVEGLTLGKNYKAVDAALAKQDFILLPPAIAHGEKGTVAFKILSPLPPRELFQRFSVAQFSGMTLKPVRIDSQTVTVRYLQ